MTPNKAIERALRLCGVLQDGEVPNGDQFSDGLDSLNSMLHSWELESIPLNNYDAASGDDLPYPPSHDKAIVDNLAVVIAPEYEVDLKPMVFAMADAGKRQLRNAYIDLNARLSVDPALNPYYNSENAGSLV